MQIRWKEDVKCFVKQREQGPGLTPGGHLGQVRLAGGARHQLHGDVGAAHAVVGRPVGELPGLRHAQTEGVAFVTDEVDLVTAAAGAVTEPTDVVGRLVQSMAAGNFPLNALKMINGFHS